MLNKLNKRRGGFTLVEIMIVVAIIALLAAIAVPGFLRARKRSQASRILNDLRMIDAAVDQYAIETNRSTGNGWGHGLDELLEKEFDPIQHRQESPGD
jgi:prepilin-type N-terminal cleavage/methylation domain-containing protein